MKTKSPLVSFVIRTKDEGKFIGKVLSLLFKQTLQDFEIIIVDSGSTDKTLEFVFLVDTRSQYQIPGLRMA